MGSLFKVAVNGPAQDFMMRTGKGGVRYTGPHLGMEHFKAWKAIAYLLEKTCTSGMSQIKVHQIELLRLMGRDYKDSDSRARLMGVLTDLCMARIEFSSRGMSYVGGIINRFHHPAHSKTVYIDVNLQAAGFLSGASCSEESLERMRGFGRHYLAMWLWNEMCEGHDSCGRGSETKVFVVDALRDSCGTTVKSRSHFVQMLSQALERLKHGKVPVIVDWCFTNPKKTELQIEFPKKQKVARPPRTPGFVYILTNPAMPGLIKIGKTRLNPTDRAAQLHTTGVPAGFQVEYACRTNDPEAVEQAMHVAFGPTRLSHKREFFQITPEQAIAVLSLHHQEEPVAA